MMTFEVVVVVVVVVSTFNNIVSSNMLLSIFLLPFSLLEIYLCLRKIMLLFEKIVATKQRFFFLMGVGVDSRVVIRLCPKKK